MQSYRFAVIVSAMTAILGAACAKSPGLQSAGGPNSPIRSEEVSAKIIAGEIAPATNKSWTKSVAAIVVNKDGKETICSGAVIDNAMILTAAHCVENLAPQEMTVVFGPNVTEAREKNSELLRQVETIRINPAYTVKLEDELIANFDLAIVKIRGELPSGYQPILRIQKLETSEFHIWPGQAVRMAGYGVNEFNDKMDSSAASGAGVLRSTDKTIAADGKRQAWTGIFGNENNGACWGDSGGPAMINYRGNWILWGIISKPREKANGRPNCDDGVYATKVAHWDDWILDTLEELKEVR